MVILTVRFPYSNKEYDYLMVNPQKIKIDREKPLQLVTGIDYSCKGVCTKPIYVTKGKKLDFLPEHVTAKIILDNNNLVRTEQLSSGEIQSLKARSTSTHNEPKKDEYSIFQHLTRYFEGEEDLFGNPIKY